MQGHHPLRGVLLKPGHGLEHGAAEGEIVVERGGVVVGVEVVAEGALNLLGQRVALRTLADDEAGGGGGA